MNILPPGIHSGAFKLSGGFGSKVASRGDTIVKVLQFKKRLNLVPCCHSGVFRYKYQGGTGIATSFERALDGLVGGAVLLVLIYISARFFNILNPAEGKNFLSCWANREKQ